MTFITDPVHVGMINYGAVRATPRGKQIRAASHGSVCSSSAHGHRRPSSPVPRPADAASHGVASCTGGCGDDSSLWQAAAVKGCSLSILGYAHAPNPKPHAHELSGHHNAATAGVSFSRGFGKGGSVLVADPGLLRDRRTRQGTTCCYTTGSA